MNRSQLKTLDKDVLIDIIIKQSEELAAARREIKQLSDQLKRANKRISTLESELQTVSKRQAAPFRKDEQKKKNNPKPPGNKKGHKGHYRKCIQPVDEHIDVPLKSCPHCQQEGTIEQIKPVDQTIEEVVPQTKVVRLRTYKGQCVQCNRTVQSEHPLKVSRAQGAAGNHIGPKARSFALQLHYDIGIPFRKCARIMKEMFGLSITAGGIAHMGHKAAEVMKSSYQKIKTRIKHSEVIHVDETSWYVSEPYWLWVFTNKNNTLYEVIDSRGRQVIEDILGTAYQGVLVSDCLSIYDNVNERQQKCYAHHLKAISIAEQSAQKNNSIQDLDQLHKIKSLLKTAIVIKKASEQLTSDQIQKAIEHLQKEADHLIPPLDLLEQLEQSGSSKFLETTVKLLKRLAKQKDHLFTFLKHDEVEATNNLAERQLRPAVVSRKISCGNKTQNGAKTWKVITSVIQTLKQQGNSFEKHLTQSYWQAISTR